MSGRGPVPVMEAPSVELDEVWYEGREGRSKTCTCRVGVAGCTRIVLRRDGRCGHGPSDRIYAYFDLGYGQQVLTMPADTCAGWWSKSEPEQ